MWLLWLFSAVRVWNRKNILSILSSCICDFNKPLDEHRTTLLHKAAQWEDLGICEVLLQKRASFNIRNGVGEAPLHIVARQQLKGNNYKRTSNKNQMCSLVRSMLYYDADIHIKNSNNRTVKIHSWKTEMIIWGSWYWPMNLILLVRCLVKIKFYISRKVSPRLSNLE